MTTNESKSYLAYLKKLLDQFSTLKAKVIDLDKKTLMQLLQFTLINKTQKTKFRVKN